MDNELESRSVVLGPPPSLSTAMSMPLRSPQFGDSDSQLSAERDMARAEARRQTTADRGPTPRDTTLRNRWHARCSCLTDQIYRKRLENLVRKKDAELHHLPLEREQELTKRRGQLAEMRTLLATAGRDKVRLQCSINNLVQTVSDLRNQLRCAEESEHQVHDVLSTQCMYELDAVGDFGDGALVQTGSLEDPYVPESSESTLPGCIHQHEPFEPFP